MKHFESILLIIIFGMIGLALYEKHKAIPKPKPQNPVTQIQEEPEPVKPEVLPPKTVKTFEEAIESAKESNCPIFLYFGAEWCGPCRQMKSTTLIDPQVIEKLKNGFVILIVDVDENKALAKKFGVYGIPNYMIVDKTGKAVKKTNGYKDVDDFIKWLD